MTIVVLVALAGVWAAVLLPPYLQKRRAAHPSSSVVDFHQRLAVLQRTGSALNGAPLRAGYTQQALGYDQRPAPGMPRPPSPETEVMRRRRDVFMTLVTAAGMTLLLSLVLGGNVWLLHLLVDVALLGYAAMLLQLQQQRSVQAPRYAHRARPDPVWDDAAQAYGAEAYGDAHYDDGYGYDPGYQPQPAFVQPQHSYYQPEPAYAPARPAPAYAGYDEPQLAEVHYIPPPRLRPAGPSANPQVLLRRHAN